VKKILLLCFIVTSSSWGEVPALCHILGNSQAFKTVYTKTVNLSTEFNWWEKRNIMTYIMHEELVHVADGELITFDDVRSLFEDEYNFDELNHQLIEHVETKEKYVYVWSYPGENEYGIYLDTKGNIIAEVGDSDLFVDGEYCPYIESNDE